MDTDRIDVFPETTSSAAVASVDVLPDGRVMVSAQWGESGFFKDHGVVVAVGLDGQLDPSFADGGVWLPQSPGASCPPLVRPGTIVAGPGPYVVVSLEGCDSPWFGVLSSSGGLVEGFAGDGWLPFTGPSFGTVPPSVDVSGEVTYFRDGEVRRLGADGLLVPATEFETVSAPGLRTVGVSEYDGRIVVASGLGALVFHLPNGQPDPARPPVVHGHLPDESDGYHDLVLTPNGQILARGANETDPGTESLMLFSDKGALLADLRYEDSPDLDRPLVTVTPTGSVVRLDQFAVDGVWKGRVSKPRIPDFDPSTGVPGETSVFHPWRRSTGAVGGVDIGADGTAVAFLAPSLGGYAPMLAVDPGSDDEGFRLEQRKS